MAQFTIEIPNDKLAALLEGFKSKYDYKDTLLDDNGEPYSNPETLQEFSKRKVLEHIKAVYRLGLEATLVKNVMAQAESETDQAGLSIS